MPGEEHDPDRSSSERLLRIHQEREARSDNAALRARIEALEAERATLRTAYRSAVNLLGETQERAGQAEARARALAEALTGWLQWHADIVLTNECWAPLGTAELPRLTQELLDRSNELAGETGALLKPLDATHAPEPAGAAAQPLSAAQEPDADGR